MTTPALCRISVWIPQSIVGNVTSLCSGNSLGVEFFSVSAGRSPILSPRRGPAALWGTGMTLQATPLELLTIVAPVSLESELVEQLVSRFALDRPGRGSVFSERLITLAATAEAGTSSPAPPATSPTAECGACAALSGICCIVQRGQGDRIARVVLESGSGVPAISFGAGTGLRDKLGLLRITIPAEKEIIRVVVDAHEATALFDRMIDAGKLSEPGRGFIYLYPVARGVLNVKVREGSTPGVASIEQIVVALDSLTGGTTWRRREVSSTRTSSTRRMLVNLTEIRLCCNEGAAEALVAAAMTAGAAGATISKERTISATPLPSFSPAREVALMIVPHAQATAIISAVESAPDFHRAGAIITVLPVTTACTYLGKN